LFERLAEHHLILTASGVLPDRLRLDGEGKEGKRRKSGQSSEVHSVLVLVSVSDYLYLHTACVPFETSKSAPSHDHLERHTRGWVFLLHHPKPS
jgi:hypothetical protein